MVTAEPSNASDLPMFLLLIPFLPRPQHPAIPSSNP